MQTATKQFDFVHLATNALGAEVGCGGPVKPVDGTDMYACYGDCATDGPLIIPSREVTKSRGGPA